MSYETQVLLACLVPAAALLGSIGVMFAYSAWKYRRGV